MQPRLPTELQHSASVGAPTYWIEAEACLRQAGRLLELDPDEQQQRLSRVVFRLASRVRSDRLAVTP